MRSSDITISAMIEWFPSFLGTLAIVLSVISSVWCEWITYGTTSFGGADTTFGIWTQPIWTRSGTDNNQGGELWPCVAYPEDTDFDASWKMARTATILSPIFAAAGMIVVFKANVAKRHDRLNFRLAAIACLALATLFQGLTLLYLQSNACLNNVHIFEYLGINTDRECRIFWSSKTSISSTVLMGLSTIMLVYVSKRELGTESRSEDEDIDGVEATAGEQVAHPELGLKA